MNTNEHLINVKKLRNEASLKKIITELKKSKSKKEIEAIEDEKDNLIWHLIGDELKDEWYEVLGDSKAGLYF